MTDSDTQELAGISITASSWSPFSGVTFAAVVAPLVGLLVVVGLALAQVVIYAGAIVGIAVAASVTIARSRARGMPLQRACGLAVVSMLVVAGLVVSALVAVLIAYGAVMKDF